MVGMLKLSRVPFEVLPEFWEQIQPLLERALGVAGEYDVNSVVQGLSCGDFQLWAVFNDDDRIESVAFTTITMFPLKKVCTLVAGAGVNLKKWREAFDIIQSWSIEQGCDTFRIVGRKGWARQFKDMKVTSIILEKGR